MSITKEPRSNAATPERDVGTVALNMAAAPTTNSIRSSGKRQALRIADFLEAGEGNARSMKYLKDILHRNSRTIRARIEAERRRGIPILSNNQTGYYWAADLSEIERFTRSMRHRANEILRTVQDIKEAAGLD